MCALCIFVTQTVLKRPKNNLVLWRVNKKRRGYSEQSTVSLTSHKLSSASLPGMQFNIENKYSSKTKFITNIIIPYQIKSQITFLRESKVTLDCSQWGSHIREMRDDACPEYLALTASHARAKHPPPRALDLLCTRVLARHPVLKQLDLTDLQELSVPEPRVNLGEEGTC